MIITLAIVPVILVMLGTPIFIGFLAAAALTIYFILAMPTIALHQVFFGGLDNYVLLAIPFFVFAGQLMSRSGIATRLIDFVLALTGRLPGNLGVATVGASAAMGAISGSSAAAVAALGTTLYPKLIANGYGQRYAGGLIASSGAIDIVIPPSIAMILYGLAAEQSIPRLFMAGIIPGILIAMLMILFVVSHAVVNDLPREGRFDADKVWHTGKDAFWALIMPIFILGGIYNGWFSPTEAGGYACLYSIIIARFIYRSMTWSEILRTSTDAAILSAQILVIVSAAGVLTWLLTTQSVPQMIISGMQSLDLSAFSFLLAINILLLIIGCFLDPTSAILVLAPLLVPIAVSVGVDPIHFGIIMTVNLAIGMFTPPFGLNLFVAQTITGLPVHFLYTGVLPFVGVQIVALIIITYVPTLSLLLGHNF